MPEISKINALAIGSVSKVDGLAKASILDIDGVAVPAAFTGLLDETYGSGAAAAYSVRRLASATTVLLRVRRDTGGGTGDDDEADVSYDSNNELSLDSAISNASAGVTATTLGQFINVGTVGGTTYTNPDSLSGTASCFADEWKDQSGNARHASQATFGSQPQIHSGTVDTDLIKENGKPALDWDGTDDVLITAYDPTVTHTAFWAQVPTTNVFSPVYTSENTSNLRMWVGAMTDNTLTIYRGGTAAASEGSTLSGQYLGYCLNKATVTDVRLGVDGSNVAASGSIGSGYITKLRLGAEDTSGNYGDSRIQEFVIYDSDNSSNKSSIEGNLNSYFSIY